jgi:hypothetical protein
MQVGDAFGIRFLSVLHCDLQMDWVTANSCMDDYELSIHHAGSSAQMAPGMMTFLKS